MAHSMGLSVVAESVETEKQLDFLRERARDQWQGFVFSRPLPARLRPRAQIVTRANSRTREGPAMPGNSVPG